MASFRAEAGDFGRCATVVREAILPIFDIALYDLSKKTPNTEISTKMGRTMAISPFEPTAQVSGGRGADKCEQRRFGGAGVLDLANCWIAVSAIASSPVPLKVDSVGGAQLAGDRRFSGQTPGGWPAKTGLQIANGIRPIRRRSPVTTRCWPVHRPKRSEASHYRILDPGRAAELPFPSERVAIGWSKAVKEQVQQLSFARLARYSPVSR